MSSIVKFVLVTAAYAFFFFYMPIFVMVEFNDLGRFLSAPLGEQVFWVLFHLPLLGTMGIAALTWYITLIQPLIYPQFSRLPK